MTEHIMKKIYLLISFFNLLLLSACTSKPVVSSNYLPGAVPKTISLTAKDGLKITADLYSISDKKAPYIILFHHSHSSRGEYIQIAPRFNELGFNCLAVDYRLGSVYSPMNGIINQTAVEFEKTGKFLNPYLSSYLPDLEAALLYTKNKLKANKIFIMGSSLSANLVFVLRSEFKEDVSGIFSFSADPGDNRVNNEGLTVMTCSKNITCPVFIAAEAGKDFYAKDIYENISSSIKVYCEIDSMGATALSTSTSSFSVWEEVIKFINRL